MDRTKSKRALGRASTASSAAATGAARVPSRAAMTPAPPGVHSAGSSALLRWLPPRPPAQQAPAGRPHFFPCCPCSSDLDELACTPVWCFSYRYLDWLLAVSVVIASTWLALLFSVGTETVGPGSPLFAMGSVVLVAYAVGWAMYYHLNLPPTVGMISVALIYRNVPLCWDATEHLSRSTIAAARSLFFTISVAKAGLYFDGAVFRSYGLTIVLLGVFPCVVESLYVSVLVRLLFAVPRMWAFTLGFLWGGVSPVLLSLCLVSLANQGFGTKTGILSVLLAAGTIDNTVIIVIFDTLRESMAPGSETAAVFGRIAMKVLVSISSGCALGMLLAFVPNRYSKHALLARFSLLILSSTCIHLACSQYKMDTAAYICSVTTACFMVNAWRAMGWHEDATPLREVFEMLWHFCHPMMTVSIGITCDFAAMKTGTVWRVLLIYFTALLLVRTPTAYVFSAFSRKPPQQRLFMAVSYWSKGLLQTALGGLVIESVADDPELREIFSTAVPLVVITGTYVVALSSKYLGPLLLPKQS